MPRRRSPSSLTLFFVFALLRFIHSICFVWVYVSDSCSVFVSAREELRWSRLLGFKWSLKPLGEASTRGGGGAALFPDPISTKASLACGNGVCHCGWCRHVEWSFVVVNGLLEAEIQALSPLSPPLPGS
ncbi:hypothetical protein F2Q70_00022326 [Brassica cretica]|uniref:Secreted protein n=1 Tax=Brassica cretica TaxID=69181 RepID=A0A8S9GU41_BRACR|nr:hypothetical protein F2Q70_00022326 [Brassica cretica]KAF2559231.1 hypothetical protein F2Q68_00016371 [Brassica cretica]